jgi:hypothetical protein
VNHSELADGREMTVVRNEGQTRTSAASGNPYVVFRDRRPGVGKLTTDSAIGVGNLRIKVNYGAAHFQGVDLLT